MSFNSSFTKLSMRQQVKEKLSWMNDREWRESAINSHLIEQLKIQTGTWACYRALSSEPSLLEATTKATHLKWVWPVVVAEDVSQSANSEASGQMIFRELLFQNNIPQWQQGPFSTWEPKPGGVEFIASELDGFLVPGLAFDLKGHRLGRGRGYYDRALITVQSELQKQVRMNKREIPMWGISFDCQLFETVPVEDHDVMMTGIITESGWQEV